MSNRTQAAQSIDRPVPFPLGTPGAGGHLNDMTRYRMAFAVVKHFPFGGMQRNMLRIAKECAARGHDVDLFASEWKGPAPKELKVKVLKVCALTNHGRNQKFGRALRRVIAPKAYDCVVGSNKMADLHVYYAGDPCLAASLVENKRMCTWLPRYREFLRQEEEVFGPDRDTDILLSAHQEQEKFIRHYATQPSRFHHLPPGIDRQRLIDGVPTEAQRLQLREELGLGLADPMVLSVGSGFRTKGVDRAIKAMASLPGTLRERSRLVVVGQGKSRRFSRIARRLGVGDRVTFTGPREDLSWFYHCADLLLHPAYNENTGNALIEAMVCGLPVLTTEACGFACHVTAADAGVVCPLPFSQDAFNEALLTMLTSPRRPKWRANGLAYCDQVDLYTMIDCATDVIEARAERNRETRG